MDLGGCAQITLIREMTKIQIRYNLSRQSILNNSFIDSIQKYKRLLSSLQDSREL